MSNFVMIVMHSLTKMRTIKEVSMKNKIAITTIILLVAVLVLAFVACEDTLVAPMNLDMSGNVLSWQAVDGAESYEVDVKNLGKFETKKTTFFVEVESTGSYDIRVRAKKGDVYSDYSETYTYVVSSMLATPEVTYDEISKVVSWNAVEGAVGYTVRVRYTDKDISADDAVIEMTDTQSTSYTLEKEEYTKPGSFTIEVKAVAATDSESRDSAYSNACVFVNSATLSSPVLTSITSTRVYWNSVSNAKSYYLEARNKDNADLVYSVSVNATTSTSVSVLLSNFNIEVPGAYTVHIKTVGDGDVYQDSPMTDASDDYVIYKLASLDEDGLALAEKDDGTTVASWTLTDEQLELVGSFSLVLTPYYSDGDALLSAQRITFNLSSETDMEKLTVTEGDGIKTYTYVIDDKFRTIGEDGVVEYLLNDAYYGKRFTAELSISRSGNGVIAGNSVTAEDEYLSYKMPQKDSDGAYLIGSASELAYIVKEPDATYRQTANIDFENYEWLCVDEFGGKYYGENFVITDCVIIGEGANVGFFGTVKQGAVVQSLRLLNVTVKNTSATYCGAIAGINNGEIADSIVTGSIDASYATAGGIAGINNGTIISTISYTDVSATVAGGVAGMNANGAIVSYSGSRGNVTAKAETAEDETRTPKISYAGGFVAVNEGTVTGCYAIGNVVSTSAVELDAPNHAGGFVAVNKGIITVSYAGANYSNDYSKRNTVSASGKNDGVAVGGFVGMNEGTIDASYANVKATSPKYVGGFAGYNASVISDSYSIGGITTGTAANGDGGFVGYVAENSTLSNVYYHDEALGDSDNRTDKEYSQYVAADAMGQTLAEKLGEDFAVVSGDHAIRNAVLKKLIYPATAPIEIAPGAKVTAIAQYVDENGTLKTITATNDLAEGETATDFKICGNLNTEGTAVIVFTNGSARAIVIVTID